MVISKQDSFGDWVATIYCDRCTKRIGEVCSRKNYFKAGNMNGVLCDDCMAKLRIFMGLKEKEG